MRVRARGVARLAPLGEDAKRLPSPTARLAVSVGGVSAALATAVGAAAVVALAWFPLLGVGSRSADLSAIKAVPGPVGFVVFDHLTYMSIARNVEDGASAFVEPLTGTGSSIYPSGYYWTVGQIARLLDTDVPTVWNALGIVAIVGLVAMCAAWALWTARGTRAYVLAAAPLLVGTLAWWVTGGEWLGLYHHSAVVLWAPWAILAMGTGEGVALLLLGLALLATAAMVASGDGRRRLALALTAGVLLGLLFHIHAYVAIFAALVVLATLVATDLLERPSPRWAVCGLGCLVVLLALMRAGLVDVEPTTKIAIVVVLVAGLLLLKPGWAARMWRPALGLGLAAVAVAAPVLARLLSEAGDEGSFFYARQQQNERRDLTLPVSSVIVHELPVLVLGIAAAIGLWRLGRGDPRRSAWLGALLALLVVTPLLTYNHLWSVDQEPYRFLPYGALFVCVLGVPWLWLALSRGDRPARASAAVAALLLLATVPTTVAYTRAVDAAGIYASAAPEVTSAYARIAETTGGGLTLLDACFSPELTRVLGGPNDVAYSAGIAYPDHLHELQKIRRAMRHQRLPEAASLARAGVGWFATHTACGGVDRAEIRRRLGGPTVSFGMPEPTRFGNPPGTRYEVYRITPRPG